MTREEWEAVLELLRQSGVVLSEGPEGILVELGGFEELVAALVELGARLEHAFTTRDAALLAETSFLMHAGAALLNRLALAVLRENQAGLN